MPVRCADKLISGGRKKQKPKLAKKDISFFKRYMSTSIEGKNIKGQEQEKGMRTKF